MTDLIAEDLIGQAIGKTMRAIRRVVKESGLTPEALDLFEEYLRGLEETGFLSMVPAQYLQMLKNLPEVRAMIDILRAVMALPESMTTDNA